MKQIILDMIKNHAGSVSSKIVIGAISYLSLIIATIILMFTNPEIPCLQEILVTEIVSSASLLGLTTWENIKVKKNNSEEEGDL